MASPFFTEDHDMFRQSVREFVEAEILPHAEEWDEAKDFPNDLFLKLGKLGFLGIRYPEEYGGSGLDWWYTAVFAEEIAKGSPGGVTTAVLVHTDMATPLISHIGTEEQKQAYLVPALKGEYIGALAITEPDAGSDVANLRTTAVREGDSYCINGSKTFITNGARARYLLLAVRTGGEGFGGISSFLFDTRTPGFKVGRRLKKMGLWCSDTCELIFEDCLIPASSRLGGENEGFLHFMQNFQGERLIAALFSVAGAQRMLDITLQYLQSRQAFKRPLAKFQVLRHQCADLATEIEAARQLTYHAVWLVNQGIPAIKEVSMAKLFATELACRVADRCVQMHGGYGYMREYEVERAFRDVRLGTIGGGTSEIMKEIIGKTLFEGV